MFRKIIKYGKNMLIGSIILSVLCSGCNTIVDEQQEKGNKNEKKVIIDKVYCYELRNHIFPDKEEMVSSIIKYAGENESKWKHTQSGTDMTLYENGKQIIVLGYDNDWLYKFRYERDSTSLIGNKENYNPKISNTEPPKSKKIDKKERLEKELLKFLKSVGIKDIQIKERLDIDDLYCVKIRNQIDGTMAGDISVDLVNGFMGSGLNIEAYWKDEEIQELSVSFYRDIVSKEAVDIKCDYECAEKKIDLYSKAQAEDEEGIERESRYEKGTLQYVAGVKNVEMKEDSVDYIPIYTPMWVFNVYCKETGVEKNAGMKSIEYIHRMCVDLTNGQIYNGGDME